MPSTPRSKHAKKHTDQATAQRRRGRPSRGPDPEAKTHAVAFRTSEKLHTLLKSSAEAAGWSIAEEVSQRLAKTFVDSDLLHFLTMGRGTARTDLIRLIISAISLLESGVAGQYSAAIDLRDWSTHKEHAEIIFSVLEAILHMTLIDGIDIVRGRESYASELESIAEARKKIKDDPVMAAGSVAEFIARTVLLQSGYRCTLPIPIADQDESESERQALDRARALIDKMKARPNDPSEFLSARVRDIMRRVEQKQADRREADFGPEIAPLLESAHRFVNFVEGGDSIAENSSAASDDVIRAEARKLAETLLKLLGEKAQGATDLVWFDLDPKAAARVATDAMRSSRMPVPEFVELMRAAADHTVLLAYADEEWRSNLIHALDKAIATTVTPSKGSASRRR
jgi:hypothetical protein